MKQGRPLRQKSDRQIDREREFDRARLRVRQRDDNRCQINRFVAALDPVEYAALDLPVKCEYPLHVHHLKSRRSRDGYADDDNLVTLCWIHHEWAHRERTAALGIGLLESVNQVRED